MKIRFIVFYYMPGAQVPEYPTFIIGPFKSYEAADAYGKDLQLDGSYTIEPMVKP